MGGAIRNLGRATGIISKKKPTYSAPSLPLHLQLAQPEVWMKKLKL